MTGLTEREKEWALKVSRFIKAELKRAGVTYAELGQKLNEHGMEETEGSVGAKRARGTFSVPFLSGRADSSGYRDSNPGGTLIARVNYIKLIDRAVTAQRITNTTKILILRG